MPTSIANPNLFITVPETKLPNGLIVPSFQVGQYACSKSETGLAQVTANDVPWVNITFNEAKAACAEIGGKLITETQWLAIAWDVSRQDCNWTGGKVGKGSLFQGIRNNHVSNPQAGTYESHDETEKRWLTLSNGEKICDMNGNVYQWVFDDVQGDKKGLPEVIEADSLSLDAPYPSFTKGMGWIPNSTDGARDWSGFAINRGGCWNAYSYGGVFRLDYYLFSLDYIGFRCTKCL